MRSQRPAQFRQRRPIRLSRRRPHHPVRHLPLCHPLQFRPLRPSWCRPSLGPPADWCRQRVEHRSRLPEPSHPRSPHLARRCPPPHLLRSPCFHPSSANRPFPPSLAIRPSRPLVRRSPRPSPELRLPHPLPRSWFRRFPTIRSPRPSLSRLLPRHPSRFRRPGRCRRHPGRPAAIRRYRLRQSQGPHCHRCRWHR